MLRRGHLVMTIVLLASAFATAQSTSRSAELRLLLFLSAKAPSEKIEVRYILYGAFGAYRSFVTGTSNAQSIEIPLAVGGKPASQIKALAWAPGCRIATFNLTIKDADVRETYPCDPLGTVFLTGQIKEADLLRNGSAEVRVDYLAQWACEFFGLSDCTVPQIVLSVSKLDAEGRFDIELPDFARDPVSSDSKMASSFQLVLREIKTSNLIAFLDPESNDLRAAGGGLKPSLSYAHPVLFTVRRTK